MLFKFAWWFVKQLRWIIPLVLTVTIAFILYYSNAHYLSKLNLFDLIGQNTVVELPVFLRPSPIDNIPTTPTPLSKNLKLKLKNIKNEEFVFYVEVAQTQNEREIGLMYRESIPEYGGMLFVFSEENKYAIWMKNTLIPLDLIFLSKDNEIVHIVENVRPCKEIDPKQENCPSYTSPIAHTKILEIRGGTVKKLGIQKGSKIEN